MQMMSTATTTRTSPSPFQTVWTHPHYGKLSQEEYLDIIAHELSKKGIALSREELRVEAVRWEMEHSGRNGRIAHQFVTWYVGQCFLKKDKSI